MLNMIDQCERYMAWIKHYASKLAYLLWITPSGQVAHATLDRRLCRTRIFSFYNRITRKVRKDSTITIDKVCYDVPMQFISAKVDIRYLPDDMTSAYILFDDQKFPIRQTNRNDNCHTKRNNLPAIDYSKAGGES